jgi:hypothetical protein
MFVEKTPEELFKEREKRVFDAIQLKVPTGLPLVHLAVFSLPSTMDLPAER